MRPVSWKMPDIEQVKRGPKDNEVMFGSPQERVGESLTKVSTRG
jgi:hypothetical protein